MSDTPQKVVRRRLRSGETKEYAYPRGAHKGIGDDPNWEFANLVRSARKRLGFSHERVADLSSVDFHCSYLCQIERSGYVPAVHIIDALAGVLELDLNHVRHLTGYAPATFHGWDAERIGDCIYGTLEDVAQGLRPELLEALSAIAACGPQTQREGAGVISSLVAVMQERRQQRAS